MIDIKILQTDRKIVEHLIRYRGVKQEDIKNMLMLDMRKREIQTQLQQLQAQKNQIAKRIAVVNDRQALIQEGELVKKDIHNYEKELAECEKNLRDILHCIPNILDSSVPEGINENDNKEIRCVGKIPKFDFEPKEHHVLVDKEYMDFETAAHVSGARFVYLKDVAALLHRALSNFMLDILTQEFGFTEMYVPYLVKEEAMFGTGQLPKFRQDHFETKEGYSLIPTSEVSLTNYVADSIIKYGLPLRLTSCTPCFRSEVGAAGKDTHGMIRQHQFIKVEMVCITKPQDSDAEHERMVSVAETILQRLGLAYRVVLLCSGDTSFCAQKTYDLEVWLPGQNRYREISSCSNCGDFQARRMKARYKNEESKSEFVHTLNGSALAVGRALIAVLENYQNKDGSITIPEALVSYMNGICQLF